jgi:DNA-binding transcriptional regulator YiaG
MGMGRKPAKAKKPMEPAELRAIIDALGKKQGAFADDIGVSRQTVVGYLYGRSAIPQPVAILARLLKKNAGK